MRAEMTSFLKKSGSKAGSRNLDKPSTPEEEQAKVAELRAAIGPQTGRLDQFADDACLMRYLRARDWNLKNAEKMLKETLAWRESYKPEDIRWSDIAGESESGKVYRANFKGKKGHTVVVMHPGRQNTTNGHMQIKQLVYFLENAILNLPVGQEQMIWLIDYKGWTMKNTSPLSVVRETASILQNHYPERLHVAIMHNPPRLFEAVWKIVKPFLDPKTFRKVKFVYAKNAESQNILTDLFEDDAVKGIFDDSNEYNFEEYSKMMQEDDQKSVAHWKASGSIKTEADVAQNGTVPEVGESKIEEAPAAAPLAPSPAAAPVAEVPREAPVAESPVAVAPVAEAEAPKAESPASESEAAALTAEAPKSPVAEAPKALVAEALAAETQVPEAPKAEAPVVAPVVAPVS
ncbi:hypothetical protein M758_1G159000 [Ceratodon purpureus]|nr:hypothetical protein M758_1G159000 [Ceratodon purpureus]